MSNKRSVNRGRRASKRDVLEVKVETRKARAKPEPEPKAKAKPKAKPVDSFNPPMNDF